ncbi:MAG TPA: PLAT/LH2 domain-containing protein [Holophagaceae bacterium]|nr:PLAT/LH2 domain-containing protein [Holophagaceae bacterium]
MKIPYEVQIHTSDCLGAGTDAQVFLTLMGTEATSPELHLEGQPHDFERNGLDLFRLYGLEDLGDIFAVRLRHDNRGTSPGWHVDDVVVRRVPDGEAFRAPFGRWLAEDEGDHALEATRLAARMDTGGDDLEHPFDGRYTFHFTDHFDLPFELQGQDWGFGGGMAAAMLRRYRDRVPAPSDPTPPRPGTALFEEIRHRQDLTLRGHPGVLPKVLAFQGAPDTRTSLQVLPTLAAKSREEWRDMLKPHLLRGPTLAVLLLPGKLDWPSKVHQVVVTGYRWYEETGDLLLTVADPGRRPSLTQLAFCFQADRIHGRYLADGRPIRGFFWNEATDAAVDGVPLARTSLVGATGH